MTQVLIGALIALVLSLVAGPFFILLLREREYGQQIREEGPQHHIGKQGTPTMGGVLIIVSAAIAFLITTVYTLPALTIFGTMLACGAIGFADDFIKLTHRRSLGLSGRWKLILLALVSVAVGLLAHDLGLSTSIYLPLFDWSLPLGWLWYPFLFFVIAGFANGVNLNIAGGDVLI